MTTRNRTILVFSLLMLIAASTQAQEAAEGEAEAVEPAVHYAVEEGQVFIVRGEERSELELPAPARAVHVSGQRMYVALGVHGARVYSLDDPASPELTREVPSPGGEVTGFHDVGATVWMEVASTSAVPIDQAATGTPAAAVTVTAPAVEAAGDTDFEPQGRTQTLTTTEPIRILKIEPGQIEISVGAEHGVKVGDRFSVFHTRAVEGQEDDEDGFVGQELVAVVEVIAVKAESSLAELGRGDRVTMEDKVEPARKKHDSSNVYPRRLEGVGEVALVIRPLIKVGKPLGGGALCDVTATYWGSAWFANLRVQPLGFGWTDEGNVIAMSFLAEGGYDGRAFAVGLGAGVATVNGDLDYMLRDSSELAADDGGGTEPQKTWDQRTRAAFALSQVARLGSRDGLHLLLHNQLLYHEEDGEGGFIYGGTGGRFVIPVGSRSSLFLEGGGGVMGYWFGAFGVFSWLIGNGDVRSLGLSASAGGAGVWGTKEVKEECSTGMCSYNEDVNVMGPMVSLGLTYRFGM